jgi:adenylate cyclase
MTGDDVTSHLTAIDTALDHGDLFLAYDRANAALATHPGTPVLRHRLILALARMKSPRAWPLYEEWEMARIHTGERTLDIDIAALGARLIKDRALAATPAERPALFRLAAERYLTAYQLTGDFYPGTNAAALCLWAGDARRARAIATDVRPKAQGDAFYAVVSRAECALILGDHAAATSDLARLRKAGTAAQRMTARAQLRQTCAALAIDPALLAPLDPGGIVHFIGQMPRPEATLDEPVLAAEAQHLLDELDAEIGFGALAAGADILFAEALLARGAELNVVLPFPPDAFVKTSVEGRPGGPWLPRFEKCLAAATQVSTAAPLSEDGDALQYGYGTMISAGLTVQRAGHLAAPATQVAIWDGTGNVADYGTASGIALWARTRWPQYVLTSSAKRVAVNAGTLDDYPAPIGDRAIRFALFGDIAGFSKLTETEIIKSWTEVMAALDRALAPLANDILARNTWGDGIFLVFSRAASAAEAALAMREAMAAMDFAVLGLTRPLHLRLGLHCGPMTSVRDPVTGRETFVGTQVNRASRIEPLTPPGTIYATEAFAAALALDDNAPFTCEYIGNVTAGKSAERLRVLSLSRA